MENSNVAIWLEKLQSPNEEERVDALSELAYEYDERAFDLIGQAISDPSPKVRQSAIHTVQNIKDPRFIDYRQKTPRFIAGMNAVQIFACDVAWHRGKYIVMEYRR